jgi:PEP-CTERM motif
MTLDLRKERNELGVTRRVSTNAPSLAVSGTRVRCWAGGYQRHDLECRFRQQNSLRRTSAEDRPTLCRNLPKNITGKAQASASSRMIIGNLLIKKTLQMFLKTCCSANLGNGIAGTTTVLLRKNARVCMTRRVLIFMTLAGLALCCSLSALADNIHLCDINQFTSCNAGSAIPIGSGTTQAWVFGTAASGEKLFIAMLTPVNGTSGNFGSGGNLWAALGVSPTQVFPNFSSTLSQEQLATGLTPGSFQATTFGGIAWTGSVTLGQSITLPANTPIGTIFIAYLEDSHGNLIAVSPWSSALINIPEPSTLMLVGAGLLVLGALAGRRFLGN